MDFSTTFLKLTHSPAGLCSHTRDREYFSVEASAILINLFRQSICLHRHGVPLQCYFPQLNIRVAYQLSRSRCHLRVRLSLLYPLQNLPHDGKEEALSNSLPEKAPPMVQTSTRRSKRKAIMSSTTTPNSKPPEPRTRRWAYSRSRTWPSGLIGM